MMKVVKVWPKEVRKGSLIGFANVELSLDGSNNKQLEFRNIRLMDGSRGPWIAFPSEKYEKDGEVRYNDYIKVPYSEEDKNEVGQEFKNMILQAVTKAFDNLGNKNGAYEEQPKRTTANINDIDGDTLPF